MTFSLTKNIDRIQYMSREQIEDLLEELEEIRDTALGYLEQRKE